MGRDPDGPQHGQVQPHRPHRSKGAHPQMLMVLMKIKIERGQGGHLMLGQKSMFIDFVVCFCCFLGKKSWKIIASPRVKSLRTPMLLQDKTLKNSFCFECK